MIKHGMGTLEDDVGCMKFPFVDRNDLSMTTWQSGIDWGKRFMKFVVFIFKKSLSCYSFRVFMFSYHTGIYHMARVFHLAS